ncbi:MarR family winged helix-turn-helix transcriptional regulator [Devosia sp.]|uniref:MarR family winged helix-turn-helix transcriptional regulator n=1 Tax=Devosia sp. TaxID=1871048 RepID=UPI0025FB72DC|nr:MarR family winged helix-turn-helix transcriptional regulator [Devosia sp.]MCR6635123.1 MarR family winged helix-turn-helix transcriptional regulator [Devosia sp.]
MAKPSPSSSLYQLIAAGQLAHKALLVPLKERGLEPGDDAILFELGRSGTTEEDLAAELGLPSDMLAPRLARLIERDLVDRRAVGPELIPGVALTERGIRIRNSLADHWAQLEEALLGELKPKHRKRFGKILRRFTDLLQF